MVLRLTDSQSIKDPIRSVHTMVSTTYRRLHHDASSQVVTHGKRPSLRSIANTNYRYWVLTEVFGKVVREGGLSEGLEWSGLGQDKLDSIRSYSKFRAKLDAAV